jgi:hypothetical protein
MIALEKDVSLLNSKRNRTMRVNSTNNLIATVASNA